MPFLDPNQRPSGMPSSGGPSHDSFGPKSVPHAPAPSVNKLYEIPKPKENLPSEHESAEASRYESKKLLKYDSKTRSELAKRLNTVVGSEKFNQALKQATSDLDKEVPTVFGDTIDSKELESVDKKRHAKEMGELREFAKGGITTQESKEMATRGKVRDFVDFLLGRRDKK